jgi:hypothetical protein
MVKRRDPGGLDETRIGSLRCCFRQTGRFAEPEVLFEGVCTIFCGGANSLRQLRARYRDIQGEAIRIKGADKDLEVSVLPEQLRLPAESYLDVEPPRGAQITHRLEFGDPILLGARTISEPVVIRVWEEDPIWADPLPVYRSLLSVATLTPASYQNSRDHVRNHSCYHLGADREIVLDLIRAFDHEITGIYQASRQGMRPAIYLKHKRFGRAPLSVFGDALRRVVLLAGTILSLEAGGILLVDEVETGLHVSVLERVFRWIASTSRQLNVQVVATTQSLEAVDAMAAACADGKPDLVAYHLNQTAEETRVKRIDADLLLRLRRERALDVR